MKQQNDSKNREKASEELSKTGLAATMWTATITLGNPAPLQTVPA